MHAHLSVTWHSLVAKLYYKWHHICAQPAFCILAHEVLLTNSLILLWNMKRTRGSLRLTLWYCALLSVALIKVAAGVWGDLSGGCESKWIANGWYHVVYVYVVNASQEVSTEFRSQSSIGLLKVVKRYVVENAQTVTCECNHLKAFSTLQQQTRSHPLHTLPNYSLAFYCNTRMAHMCRHTYTHVHVHTHAHTCTHTWLNFPSLCIYSYRSAKRTKQYNIYT